MNERLLYGIELGRCFSPERLPALCLMALIGVWLVLLPGDLSPFVAVVIIGFSALEMQFDNILYRSPTEFEALSLFGVCWRRVVLMKNLATITASGIVTLLLGAFISYFPLRLPGGAGVIDGIVYWLTIIFPLLHLGNIRSVQEPRREQDRHADNLAQTAGMLFTVLLLSVPFVILNTFLQSRVGCLLYALAGAVFWWGLSIPRTADSISRNSMRICETS